MASSYDMTGIYRLISTSLSDVIKKKLEPNDLKYCMSIKLSIEHFQNFIKILKNTIDLNKKRFVNECINKIKKIDGLYRIKIINQNLINLILQER